MPIKQCVKDYSRPLRSISEQKEQDPAIMGSQSTMLMDVE